MQKLVQATQTVKNHIHRNRAKYAVVATLVVCYNVHRHAVREWESFLDEKDIDHNEFYTPDEEI